MEISYIIVSYNSEKYIGKCLDTVLDQTHQDYDVIVIDNNSSDKTVDIVSQYVNKHKKIRLIKNPSDAGYAAAIMMALEKSSGEFIAILNDDVFLDPQWGSNLLNSFRTDNKVMASSGLVLYPDGSVQSEGGLMDKYGAVVQKESKIFHTRFINPSSDFFYNDGSSFMIRRTILEKITFDLNLFMYYDDVDFSWKIHLLDYKLAYVPKAVCYHVMGHSSPGLGTFKFYLIARNRLYMCTKNYSRWNVLKRIPIIVVLLFLNGVYYDFTKEQKGYTLNFFKSFLWNLQNLKIIMNERKKIKSIRKVSDKEIEKFLIDHSIEFDILQR